MKKFFSTCALVTSFVALFTLASCSKNSSPLVKVKGGELAKDVVEEIFGEESDVSIKVKDFYISKFEVTQKDYEEIISQEEDLNAHPSYFKDSPVGEEVQNLRPVERISWYDCLYYCNKLSEKEGLEPVYSIENIERYAKDLSIKRADVKADFSKNGYRLPTCSEWIYAASGGQKRKNKTMYSGIGELDEISWNVENSKEVTHQVGLKKANELGLFDMTGNVCEWVWDYVWNLENPSVKEFDNYTGEEKGRYRTIIGGCFTDYSGGVEWVYEMIPDMGGIQGLRYYNTGFRVVRNSK